jgi:excisionase family DNA binding protein
VKPWITTRNPQPIKDGPLDIHAVLRDRLTAWRIPELAGLLSLGRRTLYDAVSSGRLPAIRFGTAVRISYAVSTREYQTDQSSLNTAPTAARSVLEKRRNQQQQTHTLRRLTRSLHIRPIGSAHPGDHGTRSQHIADLRRRDVLAVLKIDSHTPTRTKPVRIKDVIGLAVDAKYRHLKDAAPPTIYLPIAQNPAPFPEVGTYEVRFAGSPASMTNETRQAIQAMDSSISLEFDLLADQVNDSLRQQDLIAGLSSLFSILALVLACIGVYGVVVCNISRRTREIGVLMALGARRSDVLGMVLRQSLLLVAAGIAVGIPAAILASRMMQSMLLGVSPGDPLTIALTTAAMTATAILAAYGPARRASRIDPMDALRCE